jgi:hypothetical protein
VACESYDISRRVPCEFSCICESQEVAATAKRLKSRNRLPDQGSSPIGLLLWSEDSRERLFVFRILEISSPTKRPVPKRLIFPIQHLLQSERSWRATCKVGFSMRIGFNNVNESSRSNLTVDFIDARTNVRAL